jgi:hypothetical protein
VKEQKLIMQIRRTPKEIIEFLLDPKNSSKWIDSIVTEETNEWPVKVGTIFTEHNVGGGQSAYRIGALQDDMIEFVSTSLPYHARYTFRSITPDTTELEYFEWIEEGEIPEPFTIDILQKLKQVLES